MHLRRRLDSIGETQQIAQQDVIEHEKPNFFAAAPPPPPAATNDKDIDSGSTGKAVGGAKAASTGVAVGLVAFLYILMMICKNRSRREFANSGQRSIHHRGNKRKVAPAPEPQAQQQAQQQPNITNNNDERNDNIPTNNTDIDNSNVIDEEQPQMNEEEQQNNDAQQAIAVVDDNAGSYTMAATMVGALPSIPE